MCTSHRPTDVANIDVFKITPAGMVQVWWFAGRDNRMCPIGCGFASEERCESYPLEKLRLATPDEMLGSQFIVQILEEMQDEIKKGNLRLEEDQNQPKTSFT